VYDYNQEGLLSDIIGTQELYDDEGAVLNLFLEELATYNRLTAIKLYRSINKFSNYELISLFNAVPSSNESLNGTDGACMMKIFFDSATLKAYNISHNFHLRIRVDTGDGYQYTLGGNCLLSVAETGTGHKILTMTGPGSYLAAAWSNLYGGKKYPIVSWNLTDMWDGGSLNISGDGDDLQFDQNVMCFNNANADKIKIGDLIKIGTDGYAEVNKIIRDIDNNCSLGFTENVVSNSYTQTSGSLIVGYTYVITAFVAGDDFTSVGADLNATGAEFTATGTTPTDWSHGSSLRTQGNVADYNSSGVGHNQWHDNSGNENHGTVSGALPTNLPSVHSEKYIEKTITADTTLTSIVPAGYMLKSMVFEETAGNAGVLDLGTAATGSQVFLNQTITASDFTTVVINKVFSLTADTTLYLNDDDASSGWNSASVDIYVTLEKIK
jgi:hypothetical protein